MIVCVFVCVLAPECYTDLKAMLQGHAADEQRLIVERTRKCNHPSVAVGNKAKLEVTYDLGSM